MLRANGKFQNPPLTFAARMALKLCLLTKAQGRKDLSRLTTPSGRTMASDWMKEAWPSRLRTSMPTRIMSTTAWASKCSTTPGRAITAVSLPTVKLERANPILW